MILKYIRDTTLVETKKRRSPSQLVFSIKVFFNQFVLQICLNKSKRDRINNRINRIEDAYIHKKDLFRARDSKIARKIALESEFNLTELNSFEKFIEDEISDKKIFPTIVFVFLGGMIMAILLIFQGFIDPVPEKLLNSYSEQILLGSQKPLKVIYSFHGLRINPVISNAWVAIITSELIIRKYNDLSISILEDRLKILKSAIGIKITQTQRIQKLKFR